MTEGRIPRPADGELEILRVLWQKGPSTVRAVWDDLRRRRKVGYTTVLKQLQLMVKKGMVIRDKSRRAHLYYPRLTEEKTQQQMVGDLIVKAFGGAADKLVMQALSSQEISDEELADIQKLLDKLRES
ncbi:MAG: BlaI/MecI/CopY family transcriptional regulator [Planctomycetota bacterium]|jgi:predicted transcriptional regulator